VDLFGPHQFVTIILRAPWTSTTMCEMVECKVKVNPHPPMHHTREMFANMKHLSTLCLSHNEPSMYIIYLLATTCPMYFLMIFMLQSHLVFKTLVLSPLTPS
jgi:hypothetical protein